MTEAEKAVLSRLEVYPAHIDLLLDRLQLPPSQLSAILLTLELKGLVEQLPGKFFKRAREAPGG